MSMTALGTPITSGVTSALQDSGLTSAHRAAIARIQDLALDVSLRTDHHVVAMYFGNVHEFNVAVFSDARREDGTYHTIYREFAYLPPQPRLVTSEPDDALMRLGRIAVHLQGLLAQAGGPDA